MSGVSTATLADVWRIYQQTVVFNDQYYDVPLDQDKALNWITRMVETGVTLVTDTGYIGGLVVDDPVRDWKALVETGWFDTGRTGSLLLRAFIAQGHTLGIDEIRMTTLTRSPPGAAYILSRVGFSPLETSHRLVLKKG